jgi:hypothetical protein
LLPTGSPQPAFHPSRNFANLFDCFPFPIGSSLMWTKNSKYLSWRHYVSFSSGDGKRATWPPLPRPRRPRPRPQPVPPWSTCGGS